MLGTVLPVLRVVDILTLGFPAHAFQAERKAELASPLCSRLEKATKWGRCPVHAEPRFPTVHYSGATAGYPVLRCKMFNERLGTGRACWHFERFSGALDLLPRVVQKNTREIRSKISWQLKNPGVPVA